MEYEVRAQLKLTDTFLIHIKLFITWKERNRIISKTGILM